MTKPATATEAQIARAIRAALKAGLRIAAIKPDGTVLIHHDQAPPPDSDDAKWADDES